MDLLFSLPEKPAERSNNEYNEWIDTDENLPTATTLIEEEICDVALAIFSKDEQVPDRKEEEHDCDIDYELPPTTRDLTTALTMLERGK